ncbi:MAG: DUF6089 family protein [Ferruginibacter sp.]
MIKKIICSVLFLAFFGSIMAQSEEYVQQGEFGLTVGAAHYFGDLNTRAGLNRPKPAIGLFFRKQFGNYVGLRIAGHYAQLGYSDIYSKNEYQQSRNLSFNTNIWEIAAMGDFNFFKFLPNNPDYVFTPYITLGVGVFTYDPYAYLNDKKEFLRPLGTEGQTIGYLGRKQYSTMALCIPFGAGVKYNLTEKLNISFEISHRYTFTDYLDDVSTTYVGANNFPLTGNGPMAKLLQDRSYEIDPNNIIGIEGRQRGLSKQKDQYMIVELGLSFNISTYKCPSAQ